MTPEVLMRRGVWSLWYDICRLLFSVSTYLLAKTEREKKKKREKKREIEKGTKQMGDTVEKTLHM